MRHRAGLHFCCYTILLLLLVSHAPLLAQVQPPATPLGINNTPQRDTSRFKSNTSEWHTSDARTSFKKFNSDRVLQLDSSIHTTHRRPFLQPWHRDLGNLGSPALNLLFTPEYRVGPTLGYHVFDIYRFDIDSLNYYNTNRPYSSFGFQLGAKREQVAHIFHTQNISPNWNFAVEYRKINSPGAYKIQRTSHDNGNVSTQYNSKNLRYRLYAGIVYNKEQQDENGGIANDSFLTNETYNNRETIPVRFQNDAYGNVGAVRRSSVTNMLRDFSVMVDHAYTWGSTDTLYNEDSTQLTYKLIPRFSISHRLQINSEKHVFKDMAPDSLRYLQFFNTGFVAGDSVAATQKWSYYDNRFMLNGFIGPAEKQLLFSAGVGSRIDRFAIAYAIGDYSDNYVNNYLAAELKKEALEAGQWFYQANAKLFFTGPSSGDFNVSGFAGRQLKNNWGNISAGFSQRLNSAPFNYTTHRNRYDTVLTSFDKESVSMVYGAIQIDRLKLGGGVRNYLVNNYIYINETINPGQFAATFNITQVWARKVFTFGKFVLDNELTYQQLTANAPVNVPQVMGRHQLSIETNLFKKALQIATGVEVRYHTAYEPAGYSPYYNRFYYQDTYSLSNIPEGAVFFNFRIKRFRAFFMGDQVQQIFADNVINFPGYPAQKFNIRFGFNWAMIN